jgi:hypothetical protein
MLVLLAQATHDYRAHLACGVLREHGVEAHVLHENSGILHGGASTTTASLWVHDDDWQDACEILATAPIEPLPEGSAESMNIPRELFPPAGAVAVGMATVVFAASATATLFAVVPQLGKQGLPAAVDVALAFLLSLLGNAVTAMGFGLATGLLSAVLFPVLRLFRSGSRIGYVLILAIAFMLAVFIVLAA